MKPAVALALAALALAALILSLPALDRGAPGHGQKPPPHVARTPAPPPEEGWPDEWGDAPTFEVIPLPVLMGRIEARFPGRLLAAALSPPLAAERRLGAELVYDLRLLTRADQVLRLRVDARDGRFLDIIGRDLSAAGKGPHE